MKNIYMKFIQVCLLLLIGTSLLSCKTGAVGSMSSVGDLSLTARYSITYPSEENRTNQYVDYSFSINGPGTEKSTNINYSINEFDLDFNIKGPNENMVFVASVTSMRSFKLEIIDSNSGKVLTTREFRSDSDVNVGILEYIVNLKDFR